MSALAARVAKLAHATAVLECPAPAHRTTGATSATSTALDAVADALTTATVRRCCVDAGQPLSITIGGETRRVRVEYLAGGHARCEGAPALEAWLRRGLAGVARDLGAPLDLAVLEVRPR